MRMSPRSTTLEAVDGVVDFSGSTPSRRARPFALTGISQDIADQTCAMAARTSAVVVVLVVLASCAHFGCCCSEAELDAAKKCEPSSTVSAISGLVGSNACDTLKKRLACYSNATTCCVALPALDIRREAIEKNCSNITPCELNTTCADESALSAAVTCIYAAWKNPDNDCGAKRAVTDCLPATCCGDDVVKHYASANALGGCPALFCDDSEVVGSVSSTAAPSPSIGDTVAETASNTSDAVAGFFQMDEEKADCSTASTAQVTKMKECIRNLQGSIVKRTIKGTAGKTGKGYYEVQVTCDTLRDRMKCIPSCCCDSDYARDIRFAADDLKCGDIPCAGPEHCTFGDTIDRILDCRKEQAAETKDCAWYDSQLKCFSKEGCCEAWTAKVLRKTGDAMSGCELKECPDTCEVSSLAAESDLAVGQQSLAGSVVGILAWGIAAQAAGVSGGA